MILHSNELRFLELAEKMRKNIMLDEKPLMLEVKGEMRHGMSCLPFFMEKKLSEMVERKTKKK